LASRCCHARPRLGLAAAAATALLLGALPAAPANAGGAGASRAQASAEPAAFAQPAAFTEPAALTLPPGGIGELSAENLDELLGEAELGSGGIALSSLEAPLLAKQLSRLPGIAALATVGGLGGSAGVEHAMLLAIEQLAGEGELVEELVGGFGLAFAFEEQLETAYAASARAQEPGAPETLEEAVEEALGRSPEEAIDEGLESLTLGELLSKLIGKAAHPEALTEALFAASDQEELQEILGTALTGEPFVAATAGEAAAALAITPAELAEKLGKTPSQLPESAVALFAPLHDGQQLGVFAAKQGLAFGLAGEAPPAEEEPPEAEEEEQESAGGTGPVKPGGSNAPAGTDTSSSPAATAAASAAPGPAPASPQATAAPAKVRIVGHKLGGAALTLTLEVFGAGRLSVSGHGVSAVHRTLTRAARVSLRLHITRAAAASLHRRHRLKLMLRVSFAPASGAPSVAATTVTLR
jgi:predicted transcriptional regulator